MTLLAKLEAATGPDRELDAEIWWSINRAAAQRAYWNAATGKPTDLPNSYDALPSPLGKTGISYTAPHFSQSIDAALSLAPEGWDFSGDLTDPNNDYVIDGWNNKFGKEGREVQAQAPTLALALLKAIFKAKKMSDATRLAGQR